MASLGPLICGRLPIVGAPPCSNSSHPSDVPYQVEESMGLMVREKDPDFPNFLDQV